MIVVLMFSQVGGDCATMYGKADVFVGIRRRNGSDG